MRRIDYNKIMYVVSILLIICFAIFVTYDYINYNKITNSAPFYAFVFVRTLQFILPSVILLYLYNQNTQVKVSHYTVKSKKISNCFNGYKIAHISDYHNTNSKRIKETLIKRLKENRPDIIVITGDLIDSRRTNIETASDFVKSIAHIAPIYYVFGNHESRLKNIEYLEEKIQNVGAKILRNNYVKLEKDGEYIKLIGIDDPCFFGISKEEEKTKLENIIKTLAKEENRFTILLIHRPEYMQIYSNNNVDLVFTGHAHGGQIRIPFVGGIIAPGQGMFPKYTSGIHEMNDTKTVISRGIGNSSFPFRVNNRPELVIATLTNN